jgi:hypothetical protein
MSTHTTGRSGIAKRVGIHAETVSGLGVGEPSTIEEGIQSIGGFLGEPATLGIVRKPAEREDRTIIRRDDVGVVPWPPHLDQGGIFPGIGPHPFDARMERQERRARHAVL